MTPRGYRWIRFRHGWSISKKGNSWKRLATGETITIFPRCAQDGEWDGYAWCVYTEEDGATFSEVLYEDVEEAQRAACDWLEEVGRI